MNSQQFSQRIDQARESYTGDGWWSGECPAHDDENPSLGWKDGAVKVVIKCQAGCSRQEVLKKLGLTEDDTWLEPRPKAESGKEVAATYDYRDEAGDLVFQAVRYRRPGGKKTFSLRRPDPDDADSWVYDIKNTRMILYRLAAIQGKKRVVVVEGEKDADRLALTGLAATTNPMGAGMWRDEYAAQLVAAGVAHAVVIPDNDDAGAQHAEAVRASCLQAGLFVSVVQLPDVPPKGDVSDYLDARSVDELFALLFTKSERRVLYMSKQMEASAERFAKVMEPLVGWFPLGARMPAAEMRPRAGWGSMH